MASLTYQQFEDYALHLAKIANKIGDGWELKRIQVCSEPEKVFLMKRTTHYFICKAIESSDSVDEEDLLTLAGEMEGEEERDPGIATVPSYTDTGHGDDTSSVCELSQQRTVHLEYHIVYSQSYQVPILYFNATYTNGRQLVLEDIWKLISKQLTSSKTDKWSLVTQQEHPLLHCPYYHIHPCHTAKVMSKALSVQKGTCVSNKVTSDEVVKSTANQLPNKDVFGGEHTEMNPSHCCNGTRTQSNYLVSWLSTFGPLIGIKVPVQYVRTSTVEE